MLGRIGLWLLRAVAPTELADELEGDLAEIRDRRLRERGRAYANVLFFRDSAAAACSLLLARTPLASRQSFLAPPLPATRRGAPLSVTDIRLALRLMIKQPVLSTTAILAMAVAMSLAVTGFAFANAVVFAELLLPDGDRYVLLRVTDPETLREVDVTPEVFTAWSERATTMRRLGGFHWDQGNLELADAPPVVLRSVYITPDGLRMTEVEPIAGRLFSDADARSSAAPSAILREDIWRQLLDADPEAVGGPIRVSGREYTLIGVLPETFSFPESQSLWFPMNTDPATATTWVEAFGILAPGIDRSEALAELRTLMEAATPDGETAPRLEVVPFAKGMTGEDFGLFMAVAMAALLMILAVAAANVANLVLVRTTSRSAELAVRTALGASRSNIVAQIFIEVLVLGLAAGGIAIVIAGRILDWINRLIADEAPMWIDLRIDTNVLVFTLFLAILATAIASLAPALRSTSGSLDVALRAGAAAVTSPRFGRASASLVLLEIALSVALLAGAALVGRGLIGYQFVDIGLQEDQILTASLYLPVDDTGRRGTIDQQLAAELEAAPEFRKAGLTMDLPRSDAPRREYELDRNDGIHEIEARSAYTGVGFFSSIDVAPQAGRLFEASDHVSGSPRVAVVNEPFVQRFLDGVDPVGQRIRTRATVGAEAGDWHEIVGVVQDLGLSPGIPGDGAGVYFAVTTANFYHATLRIDAPVGEAAAALRRVVAAHDPRILVREVHTLDRVGWEAVALLRSVGLALAAMGGMAMAMAVAGIYAIVAFSVQQRTREIGVRVALGAGTRSILASILGSTSGRLVGGAGLGAGLAFLLGQAAAVLPIDVPKLAITDVVLVAGAMVAAGVLATWFPARRAARIDPAEALRAD